MVNKTSKFSESDLSFHTPIDVSDPGFMIKGHKLRWVSEGVEVRRAGRIWKPIKMSELPQKAIENVASLRSKWAGGGAGEGDTIRRRDLVLTYAPIELVEERRREIKSTQTLNESVLKASKTNLGMGVQGSGSVTQEKTSGSDSYK